MDQSEMSPYEVTGDASSRVWISDNARAVVAERQKIWTNCYVVDGEVDMKVAPMVPLKYRVGIVTSPLGLAVQALDAIPCNRPVMVYAGFYRKEREDEPEFDEYAFAITSRGSMNHILDAETYTNEGAFVNHSCDPNLTITESAPWRTCILPRITFRSTRRIMAGEELTISYHDITNAPDRNDASVLIQCNCKTKKCCGVVFYKKTWIHDRISKGGGRSKEGQGRARRRRKQGNIKRGLSERGIRGKKKK